MFSKRGAVLPTPAGSTFFDWSDLAGGNGYETFAFAMGMPKLNTAHPAVRDYLIGVAHALDPRCRHRRRSGSTSATRSTRSFGGPSARPSKAEAPEAYIVGEIWHDSQRWLRGDQYDAVMNYRYGNAVSDFVLGTNA